MSLNIICFKKLNFQIFSGSIIADFVERIHEVQAVHVSWNVFVYFSHFLLALKRSEKMLNERSQGKISIIFVKCYWKII